MSGRPSVTSVIPLAVLLALAQLSVTAPVWGRTEARIAGVVVADEDAGLDVASFATKHGEVHISLPNDAMAGDHISGVVRVEPAGGSAREKRKNEKRLLSWQLVDAVGNRTAVGRGSFECDLPTTAPEGWARLQLANPSGEVVSEVRVGIDPAETPPTTQPPAPTAEDFSLPPLGQTGRPLAIPGPFDGRFDNTTVKLDGGELRKLAESPGQLVVECPADKVGLGELTVREQGLESQAPLRLLRLKLFAPDLSLSAGQTTTLNITVEGLDEKGGEHEIRLINGSPKTISLESGNNQLLRVGPASVQAGGTKAEFQRTITGIQPGTFDVSARLLLGGDYCVGKIVAVAPAEGHELCLGFKKGDKVCVPCPKSGKCAKNYDCVRRRTVISGTCAVSVETLSEECESCPDDRVRHGRLDPPKRWWRWGWFCKEA